MAKTTTAPRTISDVLGFGPLMLLLLLGTLALAIVVQEPRPSLVIRDDPPAVRHHCINGTHIVVFEGGKKVGGGNDCP